jgi:hypothetical protein
MIYSQFNDKGIPLWILVMQGKKTRTRRKHPLTVGKIYAIQKKRCGKGIGYHRIISCELEEEWFERMMHSHSVSGFAKVLQEEAEKEGFSSWFALRECINGIYGKTLPKLYVSEFELVKNIRRMKKCFSPENLQWLPAIENIRKSDKL